MLGNGVCDTACNTTTCNFDNGVCLSDSNPLTVYVSSTAKNEGQGSFVSPYSSLHRALLDIWAPYTAVQLLSGTHNFNLSIGSSNTNPLSKNPSTVVSITLQSSLCTNSTGDHPECSHTPAQLLLSADKVLFTVYKKLVLRDLVIRGDFPLKPGCVSDMCTYCPYTVFDAAKQAYVNDHGEVVDISQVATQSYCSSYLFYTFLNLNSGTTLTVSNVKFLKIRMQPRALISGTCAQISLANVDFVSCQGAGSSLHFIQLRSNTICGSFTYLNGTVTLMNNGHEYQPSYSQGSFWSLSGVSVINITNVVFEKNIILGAQFLLSFGSFDFLHFTNCVLRRNIVANTGLFGIISSYTFPIEIGPDKTLLGRNLTHVNIDSCVFDNNGAAVSLMYISFLSDHQNVLIKNTIINRNVAATGCVLNFKYISVTPDAQTGAWIDVTSKTGEVVSAYTPPHYAIVRNVTMTRNVSPAHINATYVGQLYVKNVTCEKSGEYHAPGVTGNELIFRKVIGQPDIYLKYVPKGIGEIKCQNIFLAESVYNVTVVSSTFNANLCPNGMPGIWLSNGGQVVSTTQLRFQSITFVNNTRAPLLYSDRVNSSLSLLDVNFIGNTDTFLQNPVCVSLRFEPQISFYWRNSTIQNNTGGLIVFLHNPTLVVLDNLTIRENTAKVSSSGIRITSDGGSVYGSNIVCSRNTGEGGGVLFMEAVSKAGLPFHLSLQNSSFYSNQGHTQGSCVTVDKSLRLTSTSEIVRCIFKQNSNNQTGAAIHLSFNTGVMTVHNCTFKNNTAKRGAAVYSDYRSSGSILSLINISESIFYMHTGGSVLSLVGKTDYPHIHTQNLQFTNNSVVCVEIETAAWTDWNSSYSENSAYSGVVVRGYQGAKLSMQKCDVRNNYASNSAAGLYLSSGSSASVSDCYFAENTALVVGGVIYLDQTSAVFVQRSQFFNNSAVEKGSVFYQFYSSAVFVECQFTGNSAGKSGTLYTSDSTLSLLNISMTRNTGYSPGVVSLFSTVFINGSRFSEQAGKSGSAVYADQSTVSILDCEFEQCSASVAGGCLFLSLSQANVTYVVGRSNKALVGAFIYAAAQTNLLVNNCVLVNTRGTNSGGIDVVSSSMTLSHATLEQCYPNCVSATSSNVSITHSSFGHNEGINGAALAIMSSPSVNVTATQFLDNHAQSGGAISCQGDSAVLPLFRLTNSHLSGNTATIGGAISSTACHVYISDTALDHNSAVDKGELGSQGKGGAVFMDCYGSVSCRFTIQSSVFQDNTAERNGGGVAWGDVQPTLLNNEFINNSAQYGANIASYAIKLAPLDALNQFQPYANASTEIPLALIIENLCSGALYDGRIRLGLVDHQNVLVTTNSYSAAEILIPDTSNLTMFGDMKAIANSGVFLFSLFTLTAEPTSIQTIHITVPGLESGNTQETTPTIAIQLTFRDCLMGEYRQNNICVECSEGTYSFSPTEPCAACPEGAICYGNYTMVPKSGYWRADPYSPVFFQCLSPEACIGSGVYTELSLLGDCAPNYEGHLCDSCTINYSKTGKSLCSLCPSLSLNIGILIIILLLALFFLAVVISISIRSASQPNSKLAIYLKILMNYAQMVIVAASMNLNWPDYVNTFLSAQLMVGNAAEQVFSLDCVIQDVYQEKLFYSKLIATSLLPLFMLIICIITWIFIIIFRKIDLLREKLINSLVMILFILHTTITKVEFSMFACKELKSGELWLLHDLQQRCWSEEHVQYILSVGLPSILLWVVGLPLICLLILYQRRIGLNKPSLYMQFGFLYKGYVRSRYYWEFMILYRKICLVMSLVFLANISVAIQAQTVLAVLLTSLIFQVKISPFIESEMNTLESKSILVSIITIYCGLYYECNVLGSPFKIIMFIVIIFANVYFLFGLGRAVLPSIYEIVRKWLGRTMYGRSTAALVEAENEVSHNLSLSAISSVTPTQVIRVPDNSALYPFDSQKGSPQPSRPPQIHS